MEGGSDCVACRPKTSGVRLYERVEKGFASAMLRDGTHFDPHRVWVVAASVGVSRV